MSILRCRQLRLRTALFLQNLQPFQHGGLGLPLLLKHPHRIVDMLPQVGMLACGPLFVLVEPLPVVPQFGAECLQVAAHFGHGYFHADKLPIHGRQPTG